MDYPVTLERDDNDTILVGFPDFPEAHTFGEDEAQALVRAGDALATVLEAYIKDRRPIPPPSEAPRHLHVPVPALVEAKLRLYEAMRAARVGKAELARRLQWHMPQVDRLLDVHHGSKLDQLEEAVAALGKRLTIGLDDLVARSRSHARRARKASPPRRRQRHSRRTGVRTARHRR